MSKNPSYEVLIGSSCQKSLRRIARSDKNLFKRFDEKIQALSLTPYPAEAIQSQPPTNTIYAEQK